MKLTEFLKLKKPEATDIPDIDVINSNFDTLDESVNNKVDKVDGKGLSSQDFTQQEKDKLNGIERGAEVNKVTSVQDRTGDVKITKADVGLDQVPNVTTNNQTPTYSQNSTLSNIVSGEKISVSFGKIMKAIADLISHIGSKSNPHSVTKSQVGLDNVPNVATNDQQPTFAESGTRSNIVSGETLSTLFGKIKKFFADLKTVAFTGSYTDLSNKPTSMQNPNSLTLTMNGSATNYNGASSASKSWYAPTSAGTAGYSLIGSGSGAPVWKQPPYAVCGDSPSISDRRVSITNFKLVTGARVLVKFSYPYASTATTVTLNVNGTGAKTIKLRDAVPSTTNTWESNEIVEFLYDGSYWVAISSDKQGVSNKPSVITVGSSTTTRYCDFKCTGTNDQTVIQNAINTLTAGGKIILLEGTYNFSNGITHKNDVVIEGQGKGITIINETFPQMILSRCQIQVQRWQSKT